MVRTQVYLTKDEQRGLHMLSKRIGKKQSELIRIAVDRLIETNTAGNRRSLLRRGLGIWKDHKALPSLDELRRDWDRKPA